jgi:hypothetical protein
MIRHTRLVPVTGVQTCFRSHRQTHTYTHNTHTTHTHTHTHTHHSNSQTHTYTHTFTGGPRPPFAGLLYARRLLPPDNFVAVDPRDTVPRKNKKPYYLSKTTEKKKENKNHYLSPTNDHDAPSEEVSAVPQTTIDSGARQPSTASQNAAVVEPPLLVPKNKRRKKSQKRDGGEKKQKKAKEQRPTPDQEMAEGMKRAEQVDERRRPVPLERKIKQNRTSGDYREELAEAILNLVKLQALIKEAEEDVAHKNNLMLEEVALEAAVSSIELALGDCDRTMELADKIITTVAEQHNLSESKLRRRWIYYRDTGERGVDKGGRRHLLSPYEEGRLVVWCERRRMQQSCPTNAELRGKGVDLIE